MNISVHFFRRKNDLKLELQFQAVPLSLKKWTGNVHETLGKNPWKTQPGSQIRQRLPQFPHIPLRIKVSRLPFSRNAIAQKKMTRASKWSPKSTEIEQIRMNAEDRRSDSDKRARFWRSWAQFEVEWKLKLRKQGLGFATCKSFMLTLRAFVFWFQAVWAIRLTRDTTVSRKRENNVGYERHSRRPSWRSWNARFRRRTTRTSIPERKSPWKSTWRKLECRSVHYSRWTVNFHLRNSALNWRKNYRLINFRLLMIEKSSIPARCTLNANFPMKIQCRWCAKRREYRAMWRTTRRSKSFLTIMRKKRIDVVSLGSYVILRCISRSSLSPCKERDVGRKSRVSWQKERGIITLQAPFSFSRLPAGRKLMDYTV